MAIRRLLVGLVVAALLAGPARANARETTQGEEAGYALAALGLNLVYVPAKAIVAFGGAVLGAVVGLATGGDTRSAYAIWVPADSGTFILNASNVDGTVPIEFFGTDYADQPSPLAHAGQNDIGALYLAQYHQRPKPRVDH